MLFLVFLAYSHISRNTQQMSRLHSFANDDIAFSWRLFVCNASFRIYITECLMLNARLANIIDICLNCVRLHRLLIYQFDTVSCVFLFRRLVFWSSSSSSFTVVSSCARAIYRIESNRRRVCIVCVCAFYPMHNFSASVFAHNLNLRKRTILFSLVLKHS